jgi:hypothetical protein
MKSKNYRRSTDRDEPGMCVYCDKCDTYISTIKNMRLDFVVADDWLCSYCLDDEEYVESGAFIGESI